MEKPAVTVKPERAQSWFELPMLILTAILLVIILVRELFVLPAFVSSILGLIDWLIWFAFAVELVLMTYLSEKKIRHLVTHWFDVLIVFFPILRLTRLVRIVQLAALEDVGNQIYRLIALLFGDDVLLIRVFPLLIRFLHQAKDFIKKYRFQYVLLSLAILTVFLGSLVTLFERGDSQANIVTFYDGIWWSIESITTVGYGDYYPVTFAGRLIGFLLMIFGITTFSLITASIASLLVGEQEEKEIERLHDHIATLEQKMNSIVNESSSTSSTNTMP
ncbi:two pore domain potassium channel family protein [candidate division WWE3 bacterium]|uniref:Two pore domain potassium channel family protein n=1 Tax=candidate division WWE3 bacterium TaxID=2053526 RepID=A0A955LGQ6_UNCKA|nr:two pore domain potassium channel family protein [candidate division WWE3 bacterium]